MRAAASRCRRCAFRVGAQMGDKSHLVNIILFTTGGLNRMFIDTNFLNRGVKMSLKYTVIVSVLALSLSGCAKWDSTGISYKKGSTGRALLYSSDYAAAVGRDNALCVQGAKTASAGTFNAALDIAREVKAGGGFGESVVVLNPANPQTTYANNAYFSVCQLAMNSYVNSDGKPSNNALSGEQIITLFAKASDTAIRISNSQSSLSNVSSPALVDFVQKVLAENNVEKSTEEITNELQQAMEAKP